MDLAPHNTARNPDAAARIAAELEAQARRLRGEFTTAELDRPSSRKVERPAKLRKLAESMSKHAPMVPRAHRDAWSASARLLRKASAPVRLVYSAPRPGLARGRAPRRAARRVVRVASASSSRDGPPAPPEPPRHSALPASGGAS